MLKKLIGDHEPPYAEQWRAESEYRDQQQADEFDAHPRRGECGERHAGEGQGGNGVR